MICQHHHTHGVKSAVQCNDAAGAADAALQAVAHHALARADVAQRKIGRRSLDGREHVLRMHGAVCNVVHPAVVALCHHGVQTARHGAALRAAAQHIFHHRVVHKAHIQRVRQRDGRFQRTQFLDLHQPRRLAKAVQHICGRRQLLRKRVVRTGQHHRHTCFVRVGIHRAVPHRHARHIADLIQRPALQRADAKAKLRAGSLCRHPILSFGPVLSGFFAAACGAAPAKPLQRAVFFRPAAGRGKKSAGRQAAAPEAEITPRPLYFAVWMNCRFPHRYLIPDTAVTRATAQHSTALQTCVLYALLMGSAKNAASMETPK